MVKPSFRLCGIDDLEIEDEKSFRHVKLYADLKEVLRLAEYKFRVMPEGPLARWDRALLLNLTFWGADTGGDVLVDTVLDADVVTHVAWHHLASRALAPGGAPQSADMLIFGEAIASAFDLYLVGRLLGHSPDSSFLATQIPALADAADLPEDEFEDLLEGVVRDPEQAFEDLRRLLFDVTTDLLGCASLDEALAVLAKHDGHRFAPLLHRYELSNWVLYARAYTPARLAPDPAVRTLDETLRAQKVSLDWLVANWAAQ